MLLEIAGLAKTTYYYQLKHFNDKSAKDAEILEQIEIVFNENLKKYGSPRITIELKNKGYDINEKRVARIMKENHISALPKKRNYHSYRGDVGKIAKNVLGQNFETDGPYQKLGTDITQFITQYGNLYLSPVIDFHTREVLAYDISEHPNFNQILRMLKMLETCHGEHLEGAILHSDQGWQYQMRGYRQFIIDHGMIQSMSRKGNCIDNSPTENFFGILKKEMYYEKEYSFKSICELKMQIHNYIVYYNNTRIVTRLKASPVDARNSIVV